MFLSGKGISLVVSWIFNLLKRMSAKYSGYWNEKAMVILLAVLRNTVGASLCSLS